MHGRSPPFSIGQRKPPMTTARPRAPCDTARPPIAVIHCRGDARLVAPCPGPTNSHHSGACTCPGFSKAHRLQQTVTRTRAPRLGRSPPFLQGHQKVHPVALPCPPENGRATKQRTDPSPTLKLTPRQGDRVPPALNEIPQQTSHPDRAAITVASTGFAAYVPRLGRLPPFLSRVVTTDPQQPTRTIA
jgi:hypothetical protein